MKLLRFIRLSLFVILLSTVFAAVFTTHFSVAGRADGGTEVVSGTVTNQNGNAVSNVNITATDPGGTNVDYGPVTTDTNGNYSIDVDVGSYDLHFNPSNGSNFNPYIDSDVTIDSNQTINVQLTPLTYTFSGTLTDSAGAPIVGIEINLESGGSSYGDATTDGNGNFSITAVPGEYTLYMYGYLHNSDLPPDALYENDSNGGQINMTSGNVTENLTMPSNTVTVTVEDANGNPLSGVPVSMQPTGNMSIASGLTMPPFGQNGTTDANGVTNLLVSTGAEFDQSSGQNHLYDNICATIDNTYVCIPSPITITGNTSVTIMVPPVTTYTFSGTLTDSAGAPIVGMELNLEGGGSSYGQATTDGNGNFSITAVPGYYTLYMYGYLHNPDLPPNALYENTSNGGVINMTSGNVNENLTMPSSTITVNVEDADGNPLSGVPVSAHPTGNMSIAPGLTMPPFSQNGTTNSDGVTNLIVSTGAEFNQSSGQKNIYDNLCATINSTNVCIPSPITISGNTSVTIALQLPAPTNFNAVTPTNTAPSLTWNAVSGATSYNIYRNGINIGSSTTTAYTDTGVSDGNYTYYVTAVNSVGEGLSSNSIGVTVDTAPPSITYSLSPTPNSNGWSNSQVTITFACTDNIVGIFSCPPPQTVISEGANQTITGTTTNNAGTSASVIATVNIDETPPTLGTPSWSANPITSGSNSTLTVPASDALSGVVGGEYYIGNTDPGQGNGTVMTFSNGNLSASIGSNLSPGTYTVNVRAVDAAGNWSNVTTTNLIIGTPPTITSGTTYSADMEQPIEPVSTSNPVGTVYPDGFTVTTNTNANPTPTLSESGALPSGLSFTDNGNGTANFNGQAGVGTNGTYPITITATSSAGTATQSFTLIVTTNTTPPAITSNNNSTDTSGQAITPITITTTGYPVSTPYERQALPPGLTFTGNSNGTATITGTPTSAAVGAYSITIYAHTNYGTATQTFTFYVNRAAVFNSINANDLISKVGNSYSETVTAIGYPIPTMTESGSLPSGLIFTDNGNGTATITGSPTAGSGGTYPITLNATNSSGVTTDNITLKVDQLPAITSANNITVNYGATMNPFTVTTTGYPVSGLDERGSIDGLTFTDNGDGTATINGTPTNKGTFTITINAHSSYGNASQTFTITVQQVVS